MASESKRSKLERFQNKKTQLQIELAELAVKKEMYQKTPNDNGLGNFYSMRNPQHNAHRERMSGRIRSLQKQIAMYEKKILRIKIEIDQQEYKQWLSLQSKMSNSNQ